MMCLFLVKMTSRQSRLHEIYPPFQLKNQRQFMQNSVANETVLFKTVDIKVGSKNLSVKMAGTGKPIVLFHSLLADETSFDPIAQVLAKSHQVIILHLPGFAGSEAVGSSLDLIADHLGKGISALDLKEAPILLGNGYGGFIALNTAIRNPGLASRLVLADCGATFSEAGRAAFRGMSAAAKTKGLDAIADVAMRRLFAPEFQAQNPDLLAKRKKSFLAVDPETFHGACDALASLDLLDKLKGVTVPALVLVGEQDEATPPPMSKQLAEGLPNAKLVVMAGCAHVPQLQAPAEFLLAIEEFIR
jgi:3-oxoadipate enol-lactonase